MPESQKPTAHFVLIDNPEAEQRYHLQLRGANGEIVMWSENYADERDARRVLAIAAEAVRESARGSLRKGHK